MVNPGAFQGTRQDFLTAQMDLYAAAVTDNHIADTVADIQRRYFKRYPMSLPHSEEPSAEWLAQVDDNSPDDDLLPPDENLLDKEAFDIAKAAYDKEVKLLKYRKAQIARRLQYQHGKAHAPTKRAEIGSEDPMVVFLAKLAGIPLKKPRLRTACNVWAQNNRKFVDPIYEQRVLDGNVPPSKRAALRMRVYKECFEELEEDERKEYETRAVEEHRDAVAKIEDALNAPPSQNPNDRQQILRGLPTFIQPILDLIRDYTGWKTTLLVGGPEPADQGRLNVMSFHSGETSGSVKMNFGRSERRAYKEYVLPVFGNFLKKCYTVEECRAAALEDPAEISLAEVLRLADDGDFNLNSAEGFEGRVNVGRTPSGNGGGTMPSTPALPASNDLPANVGPSIYLRKVRALSRPAGALSTPATNAVFNLDTPSQQAPAMATPMARSTAPTRTLRAPANALLKPTTKALSNPETSSQRAAVASEPDGCHPASCPPSPILSVAPSRAPSPCGSSAIRDQPRTPPTSCAPPSRASARPSLRSPVPPSVAFPPAPALQTSPTPGSPLPATLAVRKRRHNDSDVAEDTADSNTSNDVPKKRLRSSQARALPAPSPAATTQIDTTSMLETTAVDSIAPLSPAELSGSPDWFLKAYEMFVSKDLGPSWSLLVRAWAHFERVEHYEEQGKLGTDKRPPCVAAWIARARSAKYRPNLGRLSLFEKGFNLWWTGLQPEWRRVEDGPLLRSQTSELEDLRRPGKNGLLSVLAALFFWGVSAENEGIGPSQPWEFAINDVYWVIKNLSSE